MVNLFKRRKYVHVSKKDRRHTELVYYFAGEKLNEKFKGSG
jgi:hypothetical protein